MEEGSIEWGGNNLRCSTLFTCNAETQELSIVKDTVRKKSLYLFFLLEKLELPQVLVPPLKRSISMPIRRNEIELHLATEKLRYEIFLQLVSL